MRRGVPPQTKDSTTLCTPSTCIQIHMFKIFVSTFFNYNYELVHNNFEYLSDNFIFTHMCMGMAAFIFH
jgi:hypothetical protein